MDRLGLLLGLLLGMTGKTARWITGLIIQVGLLVVEGKSLDNLALTV
jgi:hypothetical protein